MCTNMSEFNLSRDQIDALIYQWIFNERDRAISRRRLLDGIRYEKLAEEFDLSVQQTKTIVKRVKIELLKQITTSFNKNKIGVFEAGTGVGKSYAYLIPSVLWAVTNKERVVVSTGTINLQQQICEKDLPAVEEILNKKIKFILMKGRQNYICLRRLNEAAGIKDLFDDESEDLDKIFEWAKESSTGSKSDLSFMPTESIWTRVNSESDACMGMRCPYHNDCFVMKVRKEASSANIIVVNHHLKES